MNPRTNRLKNFVLIVLLNVFILTGTVSYAQDNNDLLSYAEKSFNDKKYYLCLTSLFNFLEQNKYEIKGYMLVGKAYFELEAYDNALRYFKLAENLDVNNIDVKIWISKTQIYSGQYNSAEAYLRNAFNISPRNVDVYYYYGLLNLKTNNIDKASKYFLEVTKINPNYTDAFLRLAEIAINEPDREKKDQAISILETARNISPNSPSIYFTIGKYFYEVQNYEEAENSLKLALSADGNNYNTIELLFKVMMSQSKWKEGLIYLNQLLFKEPKNPSCFYNLGYLLSKDEQYEKAVEKLIESLEVFKENEPIRLLAEYIAQKYLPLEHQYRKALASYYVEKGKVYIKNNDFNYAFDAFNRGIRLDPQNWKLRYELAQFFKNRGFINSYLDQLKVIDKLQPAEEANKKVDDQKDNNDSKEAKELKKFFKDLKEEIEYVKTLNQSSVSKTNSLNQFELENEVFPKIAIMPFSAKKEDTNYYGISEIVRDMILSSIMDYKKLNVVIIDPQNDYDKETYIENALKNNVDFVVEGEINNVLPDINITVNLHNVAYGEKYDVLQVIKQGEDRVFNSSSYISQQLINSFTPIIGKIIQKKDKKVVINIGRFHGLIPNAKYEFFVVNDYKVIKNLLSKKEYKALLNSKEDLKKHLILLSNNPKLEIEEIVVDKLDERVSEGTITSPNFFNSVTLDNYVIPAKIDIVDKKIKDPSTLLLK